MKPRRDAGVGPGIFQASAVATIMAPCSPLEMLAQYDKPIAQMAVLFLIALLLSLQSIVALPVIGDRNPYLEMRE